MVESVFGHVEGIGVAQAWAMVSNFRIAMGEDLLEQSYGAVRTSATSVEEVDVPKSEFLFHFRLSFSFRNSPARMLSPQKPALKRNF
jgi:hypothetical protein